MSSLPASAHRVLFLVPKRHCPSAVARQRGRRLMREAYRQHKHILQPLSAQHIFSINWLRMYKLGSAALC